MKNYHLIAVLSALLAFSCTHQDQNVKLNLNISNIEKISPNPTKSVFVEVVDTRSEPEILGSKTFGDEKIKISTEDNIAKLLNEQISKNLVEKGFKNGREKLVQISIESFNYKAERHFLIGNSSANVVAKVVINDTKNREKFSKKFNLSIKRKHFIAPLEKTDSETINKILRDVALEILDDSAIIERLFK